MCRIVCSALVVSPVTYFALIEDGDAYHFLALVLLAPIAGIALFANSLFCLFRYRESESPWIGLSFMIFSVIGVLEAWYFLPQFGM